MILETRDLAAATPTDTTTIVVTPLRAAMLRAATIRAEHPRPTGERAPPYFVRSPE